MTALGTWLACLALLVPAAAGAQPAAPSTAPEFNTLWTGWSGVSRDSMRTESEAIQRLRHELATAEAARLRQLRNQGQALGTRVGTIVSEGDCKDGERIARAAGDFALVEAVRNYCRQNSSAEPAPNR